MPEYAKIGLFLAKVETTFGVDAAPTSALNNIPIARGLVPVEPDGTPIVREILDGGFAKVAGLTVMKTMTFKVRIELRGNRTNGVAADISSGSISNVLDFDPLLRACDLAATYVAATTSRNGYVKYQPTIPTDAGVSLTIWAYSPQKLYKAVGCKGTVDNIVFSAGNIVYMDLTFMGQFSTIIDASPLPTDAVFPSTVPPIWAVAQALNAGAASINYPPGTVGITAIGSGLYPGDRVKLGGTLPAEYTAGTWYYVKNTIATDTPRLTETLDGTAITHSGAGSGVTMTTAGGFWLDGWTDALANGCNIKLGQVVVPREDGNSASGLKGHIISGRESSGDFTIESVPEATHPLWADWDAGTVKTLRLNLGKRSDQGGSGNRVAIEAKIRLGAMRYQDLSGKRMMNVPFFLANASPGDASGSDFWLIFQ